MKCKQKTATFAGAIRSMLLEVSEIEIDSKIGLLKLLTIFIGVNPYPNLYLQNHPDKSRLLLCQNINHTFSQRQLLIGNATYIQNIMNP